MREPEATRSLIQTMIRQGRVLVNGSPARSSHRVETGDHISGEIEQPTMISAAPEEIPLTVLYRDSAMAVIDKPAGLVVHPSPGHARGTLANAIVAAFPETGGSGVQSRPGIVHRLDKNTSGLMAVALSRKGYVDLQAQISRRDASRVYLALIAGHLTPVDGRIEAPIGRDPANRKRMAVHGVAARDAVTSYRSLEDIAAFSLVEARLHTGRTHQIRVHMAAVGHPIAGDDLYRGPKVPGLGRQFLHAHELGIVSPETRQSLRFVSPLPADLVHVLDRLRAGQSA
jgi:23S rRNA pseudouridine1911/1915/1917 synthase